MGRISMPQGKGSQLHNKREYDRIGKPLPENIDPSRTDENVTVIDIPIREAYDQIFGVALREYNANQTRADRRIPDYIAHLQNSKNGEKLFYEDIIQWGSKSDFSNHPELREVAKKALYKYATTFQERNPNLRLIGAYIHMDEASPHLHLDYIPTATGYKNGLRIRNSLDRAMKEMGIKPDGTESRKNNATKVWKERERAVFGSICRSLGLTVEAERPGHDKQLTPAEYADIARRAEAEARVKASTIVIEAQETAKAQANGIIAGAQEKASQTLIEASTSVEQIKADIEPLKTEYETKKAFVVAVAEASKPDVLYPDGVSVTKKGVINRREYVQVPQSLWKDRTLVYKAHESMVSERKKLDQEWRKFHDSASGKTLANMRDTNAKLEMENLRLKNDLQKSKSDLQRLQEKINLFFRKLPEDLKDRVQRIWSAISAPFRGQSL